MSQAFLNRIMAAERQIAVLEARIYLLEKPKEEVKPETMEVAAEPIKRRGRPPKNRD